MTTRATYRSHIGRALGRNYWDSSTVAANCTVNKLFDPKRTEYAAHWDGASVLIGGEEVYVRGGGGAIETGTGILFLDRDLAGAPTAATPYEILKGWTFADVDEAIDHAFMRAYPEFFTPIRDEGATFTEIANTLLYTCPATWRDIVSVEREKNKGASPSFYAMLYEGRDYVLGLDATGAITIELQYTPDAGTKLRVRAKAFATCAATDAGTGTPDIPWQVITPGALAYLYDKGIDADDSAGALRKAFTDEAQRQGQMFESAKLLYRPRLQTRRAAFPIITERNDGWSVQR